MKKFNCFIIFALALIMSVGTAFATPPPNPGEGYYIKENGQTAGTIKYFPNGHPENQSEWTYCGASASSCPTVEPPPVCPGCNQAEAGATYSNVAGGGSFTSIEVPKVEGPSAGFNGTAVGTTGSTVNTEIVASKTVIQLGYADANFYFPETKGGTYLVGDENSDYMGALAWSKQGAYGDASGFGSVWGSNKLFELNCPYPEGFVSVDLFTNVNAYSSQFAQVAFNQEGAAGYAGATGYQGSGVDAKKSTYIDATQYWFFSKQAGGILFDEMAAGVCVFGASGADIARVGNQSMDTNSVVARSFNFGISNPAYVNGGYDSATYMVSGSGNAIGSVFTSNPIGYSGSGMYNSQYSYNGTSANPIVGSGLAYGTTSVSVTPTSVSSKSSGFSFSTVKSATQP